MDITNDIFARLDEMQIPHERYTHAPIQSALDRVPLGLDFGACVCKNLLVTTRNQSRFLLITLRAEKVCDLKQVARVLGTSRLGFAPEEQVYRLLGQRRGAVSALGIVHDNTRAVEVVFDASLHNQPRVAAHPGDNRQTVVLSFEDLFRFVRGHGNKTYLLDL